MDPAQLRTLPSIDGLLNEPRFSHLLAGRSHAVKVEVLRRAVATARARLSRGEMPGLEEADIERALHEAESSSLRKVFNATGVVLHTNLGRAPLPRAAVERIAQLAGGYSNLELDLEAGERGSRFASLVPLLSALTQAEDALVVNNNAAAVLLVLSAVANGGEVIVSRGEQVEIGGGFRVPDVLRQSGATLVEVGTTNRTRLSDYEGAITERTALLLKVHKSNFAMVGFTEEVAVGELAGLAARKRLPLAVDLGSGCLVPLVGAGLTPEPTVAATVAAGAELVTFSGDKLLGGPQAGIIVGRREHVARARAHPLNRAVRVDKLTVAALEATLELYRDGVLHEVPAVRMLTEEPDELRRRAQRLQKLLEERGVSSDVVPSVGQVGGGAMPLAAPAGFACALRIEEAEQDLAVALRRGSPSLLPRVEQGRVLLDVRCLEDNDLQAVADAVRFVVRGDA